MKPADVPNDLVFQVLHDYRRASEDQVRGILASAWDGVVLASVVPATRWMVAEDEWETLYRIGGDS